MTPGLLLIFLGSFALCALCILALGKAAPHLGLIDRPGGRKLHIGSTPVIGGLAILLASSLVIAVAMFAIDAGPRLMNALLARKGYFIGVGILAVLGVLDDRKPIAARFKLPVQIIACLIAMVFDRLLIGDVGIDLGPAQFVLGPLVWPLTLMVMLTIINAINMIDGVDGLSGGICLVILLLMSKAVLTAGFGSAPYLLALAGALAAFLAVNFPWRPNHKAHAFMGDAGSLVFGFTLVYLALTYSALPNRAFKPSTVLWFFFIPVADTIWLFIRRTIAARHPFAAGRDHIHHLLMQHFSAAQTTWILVGATAFIAGGAYWAGRFGVSGPIVILIWFCAFLAYGAITQKPWAAAWSRSRVHREAPAGD